MRKYLQQKGQKSWFEISLRNHFDFFLDQASAVAEEWKRYCGLPEKAAEGEAVASLGRAAVTASPSETLRSGNAAYPSPAGWK